MSKDIARQIDARRKKFRDEIKKEEESLRKSADNLQKQRVILAPEALRKEERKFRQKTAALQRKVQQKKSRIYQIKGFSRHENMSKREPKHFLL